VKTIWSPAKFNPRTPTDPASRRGSLASRSSEYRLRAVPTVAVKMNFSPPGVSSTEPSLPESEVMRRSRRYASFRSRSSFGATTGRVAGLSSSLSSSAFSSLDFVVATVVAPRDAGRVVGDLIGLRRLARRGRRARQGRLVR
jgi:hypothetical protein